MKNLNLLICSTEYPPYRGGIGNVVYNIVKRLEDMGIQCTVCSPYGPDIKLGSAKMIEKFGILGLLSFWHKVAGHLNKNQNDYDVIWLHNPLILETPRLEKSLITMHNTYYGSLESGMQPHIYYWIASKIEQYCLRKIKQCCVTGVSPVICRELEDIGIEKGNIKFIPNGVDCTRFRPSQEKADLRRKFQLPENDIVILSLGRLTDQKQPLKLVQLFSQIEKENNDITLAIAGEEGERAKSIKLSAEKDMLKKLKYYGFVNEKDIPEIYACSDYYIMASKYEGLPLTLLEALASGLPCIVSNIPNIDFIAKIKAGIVVDFGSSKNIESGSFSEIMQFLRRDNSSYAKNARDYALEHLDWAIPAKSYLDEFKRLSEVKKI